MRRNSVDYGVPLFMEPRVRREQNSVCGLKILTFPQTAVLFAQCMAEKIPKRVEGQIPPEVRRWSEFIGGKPI